MKNRSSKSLRIVYANWPEGYVNQRFIDALARKYRVFAFFFDETDTETVRVRYEPIDIPLGVQKIMVKDPPLIKIPFNLRLSTKRGSIGWVPKSFQRALIFRRCLKRLRPDILIGNGVSGTNPYGLCGAFSGFHPFVVLVWGSDILIEARYSFLLRTIAKFVLRKADGVIVDSEVKRKAAINLGCSQKKIWKFPWGIDIELFNSSVDGLSVKRQLNWENKRIIISTRNHFPIYGVENLIKAIPIVVRKAPDARFLIVGEGPCTNMLKKMTKNLRIDGYVYFAGKVPNDELPKYLRASDVYVSTSISDGTSNSLLESMACGLPVVVSDIPGNREWINDGKNGFLTSSKDPNALAEKIVFLVKNDKARESMRIENIELAKNKANWKQNVNVLYGLVEELTSEAITKNHYA